MKDKFMNKKLTETPLVIEFLFSHEATTISAPINCRGATLSRRMFALAWLLQKDARVLELKDRRKKLHSCGVWWSRPSWPSRLFCSRSPARRPRLQNNALSAGSGLKIFACHWMGCYTILAQPLHRCYMLNTYTGLREKRKRLFHPGGPSHVCIIDFNSALSKAISLSALSEIEV